MMELRGYISLSFASRHTTSHTHHAHVTTLALARHIAHRTLHITHTSQTCRGPHHVKFRNNIHHAHHTHISYTARRTRTHITQYKTHHNTQLKSHHNTRHKTKHITHAQVRTPSRRDGIRSTSVASILDNTGKPPSLKGSAFV